MDWGAVASAGGNIGGSVISGMFSASQAGKARHWQEKMYNQRYQRTMADLKAAGLNPMLAMGGNPGSVPSAPVAEMPDLGASVNHAVSTALTVRAARTELAQAKTNLEASRMSTGLQSDMMDWLRSNPHFRDLFLAGLAAKTAGLSPSVYGPLMATQSKGFGRYGERLAEWLFGGVGKSRSGSLKLDSGPAESNLDAALRRSLR